MNLISVADYEKRSETTLSRNTTDYIKGGAGDGFTSNLNKKYFEKIRIRPRCLRDISNRTTSSELFGYKINLPVGISPTALHKIAHLNGELETAKAAGKIGTIYIQSILSSYTIEEVAEYAPETIKFMQMFIYKERKATEILVGRAENCGYKAIVLTIDHPILGLRRFVQANQKFPSELRFKNFDKLEKESGFTSYGLSQVDEAATWDDVKWLVSITKLPVILKGILTKEDALLAVESKCHGIIVSNHGGRQLDGVPATIEALSEIVEAVAGRIPVLLDGGVRQGSDVFKALALGAKMVFVGRPIFFGLSVNGQAGIEDIFDIFKRELDIAMALSGCKTVKEVTKNLVAHEDNYLKMI